MKFHHCLLSIVCFALFFHPVAAAQSSNNNVDRQFTTAELQEDFSTLRNKFEKTLANLYLYTPKKELNKVFDSLYNNIQPMTELAFYNYITPLLSVIKDGHSNIYLSEKTTDYNTAHSTYFPFQLSCERERMFITMNLSNNPEIEDGTEILSINDSGAQQVMNYMLTRQVRDGYNDNYALWIINSFFRPYYSFCFGHPDQFALTLKKKDGSLNKVTVAALLRDTILQRKSTKYEQRTQQEKTAGIYLSNNKDIKTAILTIKSWDNDLLKQQYNQKFKPEIEAAFSKIKEWKTEQLVIDLRNNQGGDADNGIYLLSYLLNTPFEYISQLQSVKGSNDSNQILKTENSGMLGTQQPQADPFTGKLYILINGGSFSNSGIFSSRIQYYKRGIFIGSETGGNKTVLTGSFGWSGNTILPNTKIICEKANYRMTITNMNDNNGHGVVPDHIVIPTIEDILQNNDPVLKYAEELIKKQLQ